MSPSNILIVLDKSSSSILNDCIEHFADSVGPNIQTLLKNYTTQGIGHDSSIMYSWSGVNWVEEVGGKLVEYIKKFANKDSVRIIGIDILNHIKLYDYGSFRNEIFERNISSYEMHVARL